MTPLAKIEQAFLDKAKDADKSALEVVRISPSGSIEYMIVGLTWREAAQLVQAARCEAGEPP